MMISGMLLCAAIAQLVSPVPGVELIRVFGPEIPGQYKHPVSIAQLDNGDLFLAYYGGSGEYGTDTKVFGSRQRKGESAWSTPYVIADTPFRADGNAVVWQAPNGWVWLFYVVRFGDTWSTSRINAKVSYDGANTWTDPFVLSIEEGMMVRSKPIVLNDGDYLLPVYHETGFDREIVGADTTSLFLRYDVKKGTWTETNRIRSRQGNLQPAPVQISDNDLICYCRRGGGYDPVTDGYLVRAESHDGGRTWSEGVDAPFPNPNAATDFIKLKNGHLMLIYNDNMNNRTPLTVAISTDNDKTWPIKKNIAEGPGPYAYPYAIQADDEKIHVVFTTEDRTVVMHAIFDESAILR